MNWSGGATRFRWRRAHVWWSKALPDFFGGEGHGGCEWWCDILKLRYQISSVVEDVRFTRAFMLDRSRSSFVALVVDPQGRRSSSSASLFFLSFYLFIFCSWFLSWSWCVWFYELCVALFYEVFVVEWRLLRWRKSDWFFRSEGERFSDGEMHEKWKRLKCERWWRSDMKCCEVDVLWGSRGKSFVVFQCQPK